MAESKEGMVQVHIYLPSKAHEDLLKRVDELNTAHPYGEKWTVSNFIRKGIYLLLQTKLVPND